MLYDSSQLNQLVEAFRYLSRHQNVVEDAHGNVSMRVEGGFLIKPSGMDYDDIGPDDICSVVCTSDSFLVSGKRKPSVDTYHHYLIYKQNPDVNSICHTHSPYATAFAIAGMDIPVACTEHADYFGHVIRCLPYKDLTEWGRYVTLERHTVHEQAVLLGHHGAVVCSVGNDPKTAAKLAVALEAVAKKFHLATALCDVKSLPHSDVLEWHSRYNGAYGQKA